MAASLRLMRPCLGVAMPLLWAGILHRTAAAVDGLPRGWRAPDDGASEFTAGSRDVAFWHICDLWRRLHEGRLRRLSGRVATAPRGPGLTQLGHRPPTQCSLFKLGRAKRARRSVDYCP